MIVLLVLTWFCIDSVVFNKVNYFEIMELAIHGCGKHNFTAGLKQSSFNTIPSCADACFYRKFGIFL